MNLKFEPIVQNFRKIIQLNAVINLESANEYYRKIISKSGSKMDLYPAMFLRTLHAHDLIQSYAKKTRQGCSMLNL